MNLQFLFGSVFVVFVLFGEVKVSHGEPQRSRLRGGVTPGPEVTSSSSQASDGPLNRLRRPTRRTTPLTTTTLSTTTATTTTTQGQRQPQPQSSHQRQTNNDSFRLEMIEKLCNRKYGSSSPSGSVSSTTTTPTPKKHVSTPKPSSTTTPTTTTTTTTINQRGVNVKAAYTNDNFSEPQRTLPRKPLRFVMRSQTHAPQVLAAPAHIRVPRRVKKLTRSTTASTSTTSTTEAPSVLPPFSSPTSSPTPPVGVPRSNPSCPDFDHLTNEQLAKRVKGGIRRKHKPEN